MRDVVANSILARCGVRLGVRCGVKALPIAVLLLALLLPGALSAHEEVAGGGAFNYTRVLKGKGGQYQLDLMYSPSLPTAGEPANIGIGVKRLLETPDPLLGSEVPLTTAPDVQLVDQKSKSVVVDHLPIASEGTAGDFEISDYKFPKGGSFLIRVIIHTDAGDSITEEIPVTVQADAAGMFRLWVNLAVGIMILGLTALQLKKVRSRDGERAQMMRPVAIGLVSLAAVVFVMDYFVVGAVLDLRKTKAPPTGPASVTSNEDGSYSIPAAVQKDLDLAVVGVKEVALVQTVLAYGIVEGRADLTAIVQAPLWGRIEWSKGPLAVGDHVKKNQELVQVVLELNALERGAMETKDRDIKGAKKHAEDRRNAARLEYDRVRALHAKDPSYEADEAWAKQLFDQANADYNEIVKQDLNYQGTMKFRDPRRTPVASPINGVITTIDFVPGQLNQTTNYKQLFTIVDPSQVWVRAQVFLADVARLKDGDSVRVYPPNADSKAVSGKIRWIGDTIDPASRTAPVLIDVSNEGEAFALGSFARVEFEQPHKVLAVPEQAVIDEGTSRWVYVVRPPDSFAPVKVEMGVKQDGLWQVNSGLSEGDQVIAKGAALLGSMPRLPQTAQAVRPPPAPPVAAELTEAAAEQK
jgi:membrane fusion protein, heavy metal efflux system